MTQIIDLGKLRFHLAGDWDANTAYERNDVVRYGGNIYCYIFTLKEAGVLPTDASHWALMVKGINFTGPYGNTNQYRVGDAMSYGGVVYVCIADVAGQAPPNAACWSQFVDGISYQGAYSNTASYKKNDLVTYGGVVYVARQDSTGNLPTVAASWNKLVDGISPQSVFNAATAYLPNDLVAYGGNIYRAMVASSGVLPPSDPGTWELWVGGHAFAGVWSAANAYQVGQIVTYGGGVYRAKVDTSAGQLPTDTGKFDAFFVGMAFLGAYSTSAAYKVGDVVTYGANLYRAKQDTQAGDLPTGSHFDLLNTGMRNAGVWAGSTTYYLNDVVSHGGNTYIALAAHAAGAFATDLGAGKWQKFNGGIRWQGAWTAGTAYLANDMVADGTTTYIVTADYTSGSANATADYAAGKLAVMAQGQANVPNPAAEPDGKVLTTLGGAYVLADGKPKVLVLNAAATLADGVSYALDSSAGAFEVTLPANPSAGARVQLSDAGGNLQGFPVMVLRNGSFIETVGDDLHLNVNRIALTLTYINATIGWRIS